MSACSTPKLPLKLKSQLSQNFRLSEGSRVSKVSTTDMKDVSLMDSAPQTFVGLRNGVSFALIVVVAEMFIGSVDGLGFRVFEAQQPFGMPEMCAAIFAAMALYELNIVVLLINKSFVHWSGK
jgi:ABC-type nitrate/sulfonate/bicarbonate transport system permease component